MIASVCSISFDLLSISNITQFFFIRPYWKYPFHLDEIHLSRAPLSIIAFIGPHSDSGEIMISCRCTSNFSSFYSFWLDSPFFLLIVLDHKYNKTINDVTYILTPSSGFGYFEVIGAIFIIGYIYLIPCFRPHYGL